MTESRSSEVKSDVGSFGLQTRIETEKSTDQEKGEMETFDELETDPPLLTGAYRLIVGDLFGTDSSCHRK